MDGISYRTDKAFDVEAWLRFFHDCDWNRDWTVRNLEAVREHAYMIVTAWAGDEMVGTLTVLSDGMNYATIDDVVVGGGWRRRGIGSELMRQAIARLQHIDPDLIRLHAIPGVEAFYERLGFARINETPMHLTP
jgi:ribosomal protein S18 acetylase RimI-like enzyme